MQLKHTKGNWKYKNHEELIYGLHTIEVSTNIDGLGEWIAKVRGNGTKECESNAKLIASAPDLLEACIIALDECCDLIGTPAGKAIELAIKKATE